MSSNVRFRRLRIAWLRLLLWHNERKTERLARRMEAAWDYPKGFLSTRENAEWHYRRMQIRARWERVKVGQLAHPSGGVRADAN